MKKLAALIRGRFKSNHNLERCIMSVKISLGKKKKTFNSIMEAAEVVATKTGEPVQRVYIRFWKRLNSGKKPATAMKQAPRKYVRKVVEQVQQAAV